MSFSYMNIKASIQFDWSKHFTYTLQPVFPGAKELNCTYIAMQWAVAPFTNMV